MSGRPPSQAANASTKRPRRHPPNSNDVCRLFLKGNCTYGRDCKFKHQAPNDADANTQIDPSNPQGSQVTATEHPLASTTEVVLPDRTASESSKRPSNSATTQPDAMKQSTAHALGSNPPTAGPSKKNRARSKMPCRYWNLAGKCVKGDRCLYVHDPEVQEAIRLRDEAAQIQESVRNEELRAQEEAARIQESIRIRNEVLRAQAEAAQIQESIRIRNEELRAQAEAKRQRIQLAEAARKARIAEEEAARQARAAQQEAARRARQEQQEARRAEIAKEEAAKTIQHVVLDFTVITFGAGVAIQGILTGFESCRVRVKNLPLDAKFKEVCELFTQQGIDPGLIHIIGMNRTPDAKQEAHVVCPEDAKSMAIGLDGIDFRQEKLTFEVFQNSSAEGMRAAAGSNPNVLGISWRPPSVGYVATYTHVPQAEAKARQLNGKICAGRKVKVEMNRQPAGQTLRHLSPNAITIRDLPPKVTNAEVEEFCGSGLLRRLKSTDYDVAQVPELLRHHIESRANGQLKLFEREFTAANGISTIQAHFNTWDQAKEVYDSLDKQRIWYIGNALFMLRLPNPLEYSITIPVQQYRAQQRRWSSVQEDIKDKKGCNLVIHAKDRICIIRVVGDDRKAVGSLKVRVEVLAAGEKLQSWHRSLGYGAAGQRFLDTVFETTGAFVRNDWRNRALRVFGESTSVDAARTMVVSEIERLESLEQTVLLKRQSVRFFMNRGLAALKEELGEDNVTLDIASSPCRITIRGTESARHTLNRLIEESLQDLSIAERVLNDSNCPICYDDVSSPVQLACGHSYCTGCIQHFLTAACKSDKFPLSCMGDEDKCGVPIPIPMIQKYLPPQQFNQLLETAFFTHIEHNPQEFKYCTTPDCSQVYRSNSSSASMVVHCPSCFSAVCSSCHEEGHEGMTCAERKIQSDPAEQERLNDEFARQHGIKKCPQCKVWIEKTEGCNHMSCKCGAHICWVCMGIFTPDTIYNHMNMAHGGIDTAVAAPAPNPRVNDGENFAVQQEVLRQARLRLEQRRLAEVQRETDFMVDFRWERERVEQRRREEQLRRDVQLRGEMQIRRAEQLRLQRAAQSRQLQLDEQRRTQALRTQEAESSGWGCVVM